MNEQPAVTVAIPVLNEEEHIEACLAALQQQTYSSICEILVVDGGSTDRTRHLVEEWPGATLLDNPRRIQAAALNLALRRAQGDVFVRIDGHCVPAPDYVETCVEALERTGAAMVGGAMVPVARSWKQRGIAEAMRSRLGAGPAAFHSGGEGWVDTVYLGAYRTQTARELGGYAEDVGVNEDAELAVRMRQAGGVWLDPAIQSTYTPRGSFRAVAKQFYRYGRSRAATVRRHPSSLAPRQLVAPLLVLALVSPWRRKAATAYAAVISARAALVLHRDPPAAGAFLLALSAMHVPWGLGFLRGLVRSPQHPATPSVHSPKIHER